MIVKDNRRYYPESRSINRQRDDLKFKPFLARVLTVDYERHVVTLEEYGSQIVYKEVFYIPAPYSSTTGGEMYMPEQFSTCVAASLEYTSGFSSIIVLSWIGSDTIKNVDAIAQRAVDGTEIQGWSDRLRGTYRKAYPGQKTASFTGGYSEKLDMGWDQLGTDFSRNKLDTDRRAWTQITNRKVFLTGSGVGYQGPVNRPNATNITGVTLPDGSQEYVAYLQPGAIPSDRYISGKQDVIPFSEDSRFVQEYALDYIPPMEVIQTTELDILLGTTADPWNRTTVTRPSGQVAYDNETYMISQSWDHPDDTSQKPLGPTLNEGSTPSRRAFIMEEIAGTLVGYNQFDPMTYGQVLKPVLFVGPPNVPGSGRFGADVESGYMPVVDSVDHTEARLAASCLAIRFPYEQNTTRLNVTKEGLVQMEIGSTLPKENIMLQPQGSYEYPYGAGRSLEAHLVGSAKLVVGKNRDEEDALDVQALGQSVIRLGADDTGLPNARRTVGTQIRSKGDAVAARAFQYWTASGVKLKPGDSGVNLQGYNKTGAESVSLRAAMDGAAVVRLGARNPAAKRRHLINGYQDGPGKTAYAVGDSNRVDSHSPGRPNYGAGDSIYRFNDLTLAGQPQLNYPPYNASDWITPVPSDPNISGNTAMDQHGLSFDLHSTRDILMRVGKNPASGQSILIDTDGGLVATIGADNQGRSLTATLFGGCQIVIRPNKANKALSIELQGDVDIVHKGNLQYQCTGDWVTEQTTWRNITKTDRIFSAQKVIDSALVRITNEAPDIVNNQGSQVPVPGGENS